MFEIRVICDPDDTERVSAALSETFTTGAVRRSPSRTSDKERLYVTADHRTGTETWPTPEKAYSKAPSVISEIGWVTEESIGRPTGALQKREFWLRKAALLDRLALGDAKALSASDATELATEAARHLMDLDDGRVFCDPRSYVRQQYALWITQQ
ncbi:hypothetical protein ACWGQ4_19190 [Streptomyces sp. NPDC055721]|uniref:hypothetical protein n=1 Tax=Streptomyces sp. NPDC127132 TaxID=3345374 RepID=UPI0036354F1D